MVTEGAADEQIFADQSCSPWFLVGTLLLFTLEPTRHNNVGGRMSDDGERDDDCYKVDDRKRIRKSGPDDEQPVNDRGEPLGPEPSRGDPFAKGKPSSEECDSQRQRANKDQRENAEEETAEVHIKK